MSITVRCGCGSKLSVKETAAGKRVRCPKCNEPVAVPVPSDEFKVLGDAPPEVPDGPTVRVMLTQKNVEIRRAPAMDAPPLVTLEKGGRFYMIEGAEPVEGAWLPVRTITGKPGFVPADTQVAAAPVEADAGGGSDDSSGGFGLERAGINKGVVGGIVMLVIAVVWFVAGWMAGYIFFYPPILAVIGIFAIIKGLVTGNISGD